MAGHGLVFGEGCRCASRLQAMDLAKGEQSRPTKFFIVKRRYRQGVNSSEIQT
jgi:hypothetical protein